MPTLQEYEEFFTTADKDGSGSIKFDELVEMLKGKGYSGSDSDLKVSDSLSRDYVIH